MAEAALGTALAWLEAEASEKARNDLLRYGIPNDRAFAKAPDAWPAVPRWAASEQLYIRRAAFALVWALTRHDKKAGDATFLDALAIAETHAADPRPHVTKAISMAVRAIGKRNTVLRGAALAWAERLPQTRLAREVTKELAKTG